MKPVLFILFLITSYYTARGQIVVRGKITTLKNKALEFATISVIQDAAKVKTAITDSLGHFKIAGLRPGSSRFIFSHLHCIAKELRITLLKDSFLTITLEDTATMLMSVLVQANKPLVERKTDRLILNIENSPYASGLSSLELLSLAPGVITSQDGTIFLNRIPGVRVMLNDQMLQLTGSQLTDFLNGLRSEDIKSIELIPHPSAGFDAEGGGGIIKIITRKKRRDGMEGSIHVTYKQGVYPKSSETAGLHFKKGNVVMYATYSHGDNKNFYNRQNSRVSDNAPLSIYNNTQSHSTGYSNSFRTGMEYNIGSRHFAGIQIWGEYTHTNTSASLTTTTFINLQPDTIIYGNYPKAKKNQNYSYSLNYQWTLDTSGRLLKILADYTPVSSASSNLYENSYYTEDKIFLKQVNRKSNIGDSLKIFTAQADFVYPVKGKRSEWQAGAKLSYVTTRNANRYDLYNFNSGKWDIDPLQTNHFNYKEHIHSGYINFSSRILSLEYIAGLRIENTSTESISTTAGPTYTNNYTKWFPNILLKYSIKPGSDRYIAAGYSKRITRAPYILLNPFSYLLDEYTIKSGNPYLQPAIIQTIEISYSVNRELSFTATHYSMTNQFGDIEIKQGNYTNVTFGNLTKTVNWEAGMNVVKSFNKWCSLTGQVSVNYSQYSGPYYKKNYTGLYAYLNGSFIINPKLNAGITATFVTKGIDRYYKDKLNYFVMNGTIQQKLIKDNVILSLGVTDLFYRNGYKQLLMDYKGQHNTTIARWDTRQLFVSIQYKFKKGVAVAKKEMIKSNTEEMNRTN